MAGDPYAALGVKKTASQEEIKKAYKRIARESHPDLNPDDAASEGRFKAASAAYDLLKDPEKRARFDRGEIDASGQERAERRYYRDFAEAGGGPQAGGGFEEFDLGDLFAEMAGRRGRGPGGGQGFAMRGATVYYTVELDFLEAARGGRKRLTLPGGESLDLAIPAGIAEGEAIRLPGKGGPGHGGGPAGDALVAVTIRPHRLFRREGDDILLELPITIDEAILGGKVEVPTIGGKVALTIPKGVSSGRQLRLRGRGIARGGGKGDQIVTLKIVAPDVVDSELEEFMRGWRERHRHDPRKGMKA
jgi:DnaJ-class molecular chaperone